MTKKYYAVKVGRRPGVYTSWPACQKEVSGFSGAIYKSFKTEAEALAFIASDEDGYKNPYPQGWIDGSYDKGKRVYGWGAILLAHEDAEAVKLSGADNDRALANHRNVAGELLAAEAALRYAEDAGWEHLHLYYDYEGIAAWAEGRWRANLPLTKDWQQRAQKTSVKLIFHKVKSHSGVALNNAADALAKKAIQHFKV